MSGSNGVDIPKEVKDEIRAALKSIKTNTPNFRDRPSQRKLIAEVTRTLAGVYGGDRVLVIEAPTGTGKSIGYMLGAIPLALQDESKVVISTGTVALQEQLVYRDIPLLQERSGLEFSVGLVKGRGRYVCNRNLGDLSGTNARQQGFDLGEEDTGSGVWPFMPEDGQVALVKAMQRLLDEREWNGDLDDWNGDSIDEQLKAVITTDNAGCTGQSCPQFRECAFQRARKRMWKSDVVVANHDLVMSDVNLGGGVLLPDPTESFFIFDEAHHLPDVALNHAASQFNLNALFDITKTFPQHYREAISLFMPVERVETVFNDIKLILSDLQIFAESLGRYIKSHFDPDAKTTNYGGREEKIWRMPHGKAPPGIIEVCHRHLDSVNMFGQILSDTIDHIKEGIKKGRVDTDKGADVLRRLGRHRFTFEKISSTVFAYSEPDVPGQRPMARFITLSGASFRRGKKGGKAEQIIIAASPISASEFIKKGIIDKAKGVVFTSATISSLGNFNRFAERAGVPFKTGAQFFILPSPFNHAQNGRIEVPFMMTEPSFGDAYTTEVLVQVERQVDATKGTLALFTSRRMMEEVHAGLSPTLKSITLVQGEMSKHEILDKHAEKVKDGKGSLIFGLASFSEGVDLPGALCEHVIITKLPFSVPDSPVEATYSEWLEAEGRNPFMEMAVPDACIKLVQACGRLIRTETDVGKITILDKRIITKRYGPAMLSSLPPMPLIVEQETKETDMVS